MTDFVGVGVTNSIAARDVGNGAPPLRDGAYTK